MKVPIYSLLPAQVFEMRQKKQQRARVKRFTRNHGTGEYYKAQSSVLNCVINPNRFRCLLCTSFSELLCVHVYVFNGCVADSRVHETS